MKLGKLLLAALATTALAGLSVSAQTTLTFDDVSTSGYVAVPVGYGGLQWSNFNIHVFEEPYYARGVVSPSNSVFNGSGDTAIFKSSSLFNLDSAYLTSVFESPQTLRIKGLKNNTLLYDQTHTLNNLSPTLINFNYDGVDTVQFVSFTHWFTMDDLTISPVPEPGTLSLALMAAGSVAVFRFCRRYRDRTKGFVHRDE